MKLHLNNSRFFFCIGAAKSGTTSLHHYLAQHPDILLPNPKKETRFFSHSGFADKNIDFYLKHFYPPPPKRSGQNVIGEICPEYMIKQSAHRRIFDSLGRCVKIIFIVRDPVERAYSHFCFQRYRRKEFRSFDKAVREELGHLKISGDYACGKWVEDWDTHYVSCSLYHRQIVPYIETFGRDNILCINFKELVTQPSDTLKRVCQFIEVDSSFLFDHSMVFNPTYSIRNRILDDILHTPNPAKELIKKILALSIRITVKKWFNNVNRIKGKKEPISKDTWDTLFTFFSEENQKLKAFFPSITEF